MLHEKASGVMLSRVDVTTDKKLAEKYEIQSLPGLVLFRRGEAIAYSGPREAQGMADWVEKKTQGGIIEIDKPGELQYIVEEEKIFVVGYISDRQDRGIFDHEKNYFEIVKLRVLSHVLVNS